MLSRLLKALLVLRLLTLSLLDVGLIYEIIIILKAREIGINRFLSIIFP